MLFKVVRCPKCGAIQPTSASEKLKCKQCGVTSSLRTAIVFATGIDASKASSLARKLKAKEA